MLLVGEEEQRLINKDCRIYFQWRGKGLRLDPGGVTVWVRSQLLP